LNYSVSPIQKQAWCEKRRQIGGHISGASIHSFYGSSKHYKC